MYLERNLNLFDLNFIDIKIMGMKFGNFQNFTELNAVTLKDLEQKTQMNKDQITSYHKKFLENCPNGRMTKDIFKKIFSKFQPAIQNSNKGEKYCKYVFR